MDCPNHEPVYKGYFSYIHMIRWDEFISNIDGSLFIAEYIKNNASEYDIHVNV